MKQHQQQTSWQQDVGVILKSIERATASGVRASRDYMTKITAAIDETQKVQEPDEDTRAVFSNFVRVSSLYDRNGTSAQDHLKAIGQAARAARMALVESELDAPRC